jgi:hypothetical protein
VAAPAVEIVDCDRLLGVMCDINFNFDSHVDKVVKNARGGMHYVYTVSGCLDSAVVKIIYTTLVLSHITYAIEAWWPFLSATNRQRLSAIHVEGCRCIIRAPKSTRGDACLAEAGFRSLEHIAQERLITFQEKVAREPVGSGAMAYGVQWLRARMAGDRMPDIFQNELYDELPVVFSAAQQCIRECYCDPTHPLVGAPRMECAARAPLALVDSRLMELASKRCPPWAFETSPPGGLVKKQATLQQLHEANAERIRQLPRVAIICYTDGGADQNTRCVPGRACGSYVVTVNCEIITTLAVPAGAYACSFTAEAEPQFLLLRWLAENIVLLRRKLREHFGDEAPSDADTVRMCLVSDSRSNLQALAKGPSRQHDRIPQRTWDEILHFCAEGGEPTFHFVFSHAETRGNDMDFPSFGFGMGRMIHE